MLAREGIGGTAATSSVIVEMLLNLVAHLDRSRFSPMVVLFSEGPLRQKLIAAGITTVEQVADMTPEQLEAVPGIGEKTVERIIEAVRQHFGVVEPEPEAEVAIDAVAEAEAEAEVAPPPPVVEEEPMDPQDLADMLAAMENIVDKDREQEPGA